MCLARITAVIGLFFINCQFAAAQYGGPPPPFAIIGQPPVTTNSAGNLITSGTSTTPGMDVKLEFSWYNPMPIVVTQPFSTTVAPNGTWSFNPPWGNGANQIPYVSGRAMRWNLFSKNAAGGWTLQGTGTTTMQ